MSFKKFFDKLFGKNKTTEIETANENDVIQSASDAFPVLKLNNEQLKAYKAISLSSIASLGTAFAQMSEKARTVVQTVTKTTKADGQLYTALNPKNVIGHLQRGKYGLNGNITGDDGKFKGRLEFKEYTRPLQTTETTTTTIPYDPTLMVIAVAIRNIEKKLEEIQKCVEEVLQFLKQDKQSKQRGNLNMLTEILEDYKLNCESEHFCSTRATEVLAIKAAAYQDIEFYQMQIENELQKQKKLPHFSDNAQKVLDSVAYQFTEYQLANHIFAFSTFLGFILQKNFDSALIENETKKMLTMKNKYDELYSSCYDQIEKYQSTSIETVVVDGFGKMVTGIGKAVGSVPIIKNGSLDEALISAGENIVKQNKEATKEILQTFVVLESSRMTEFIDNLENSGILFNTENAMITDGENLYVLQSSKE